ncbi:peptide ABC transporter substrate-binding protein, partial [Streptococcus agalactiae]
MQVRAMIKLGTVAALTAISLAACGTSSKQSQNQTLTWMETSSLPTMDNSLATDVVSGETLNN